MIMVCRVCSLVESFVDVKKRKVARTRSQINRNTYSLIMISGSYHELSAIFILTISQKSLFREHTEPPEYFGMSIEKTVLTVSSEKYQSVELLEQTSTHHTNFIHNLY